MLICRWPKWISNGWTGLIHKLSLTRLDLDLIYLFSTLAPQMLAYSFPPLGLCKPQYINRAYIGIKTCYYEPNKTIINILDIRAQVTERQRRWSEELNAQSEDIDKGEISEFIQYKIMEYGFYNMTDDDLWELYHEDFSTFTLEVFKNCNRTTVCDF